MIYDPEENVFVSESGMVMGHLPHVMWHITDACPLGCPYCFAPKTKASVGSDKIPLLVDHLQKLGVQKVDIAGGEPLVHLQLPSVVGDLHRAGIYQTITTSGIGTKRNRDFIVQNIGYFSRVIVSIDAPTESSHNGLRANQAAWKMLTTLLDRIPLSTRMHYIRINTVVTKPFVLNDWLPSMAEYVANIGVREWCIIQPHPANQKPAYDSFDVTENEYSQTIELAQSLVKNVKLLYRNKAMYSTYWALHPTGMLTQHTNSAVDGVVIDLLNTPVNEIRAAISQTLTIPPSTSMQGAI